MHFSGRAPFDNFVGAFLDQFWEQWASFRGPFPKTVERLAAAVWPALPASRPNEDLQRMGISEEVFWHSFFRHSCTMLQAISLESYGIPKS